MKEQDLKRISRLTAIQTQLQAKRLVTAPQLAERFQVSVRTIYRDLKTLEQAGVPIRVHEGKGFGIMEGYKLPPIMFSEDEANALITAEKLVYQNKDASFIKHYTEAITKIKAVLGDKLRDKVDMLGSRTYFGFNQQQQRSSDLLSTLQLALTHHRLTKIDYKDEKANCTQRLVEPFALLHTDENWLLLGYCRLRQAYRFFRLDRIAKFTLLDERFESHNMTLEQYFNKFHPDSLNP